MSHRTGVDGFNESLTGKTKDIILIHSYRWVIVQIGFIVSYIQEVR